MQPIRRNRVIINIVFVGMSVCLGLLFAEIALRVAGFRPAGYWQWPPRFHTVFTPDTNLLPGIAGASRFLVNSSGIRADECPRSTGYRILALGGSTTICLYLDQEETWPYRVQQLLNGNARNLQTWVGNLGKSGFSSRHHVLQMEHLVPQYNDTDAILMLVGLNDLTLRLLRDVAYDPQFLQSPSGRRRFMRRTFWSFPTGPADLLDVRNTAMYRALENVRQAVSSPKAQDHSGRSIGEHRARRRNAAEFVDILPDLGTGLAEYERNLRTCIRFAADLNVRLVCMTQPTLWRTDLRPEEEALLWGGKAGDPDQTDRSRYYSAGALARGMARYNERLREVCIATDTELIDLAAHIPKTTRIFYDDCHFSEYGAALVAKRVADHLLAREPFTPTRIARSSRVR